MARAISASSSLATAGKRRGCAGACSAQSSPESFAARIWRAPTPTWMPLSSPRTPIPSATWCWRRWPPVFPPSSLRMAARHVSCAMATQATSARIRISPQPSQCLRPMLRPTQRCADMHASTRAPLPGTPSSRTSTRATTSCWPQTETAQPLTLSSRLRRVARNEYLLLLYLPDIHPERGQVDCIERCRITRTRCLQQCLRLLAGDALLRQIEADFLRLRGKVAGHHHSRLPGCLPPPGEHLRIRRI